MIEGEDACEFCGTKTFDEFWGPSCCASSWCFKEVEAIKAERDRYKAALQKMYIQGAGQMCRCGCCFVCIAFAALERK